MITWTNFKYFNNTLTNSYFAMYELNEGKGLSELHMRPFALEL